MNNVEELVAVINEHFNRTLTTIYCKDIKEYNLDTLNIHYLFHKLRNLGYIVSIKDTMLSVMLSPKDNSKDNRIVPGFVELHTMAVKRNDKSEPYNYQYNILINISAINTIQPFEDKDGNLSIVETNEDCYHVVETLSEIKGLLIKSLGEA